MLARTNPAENQRRDGRSTETNEPPAESEQRPKLTLEGDEEAGRALTVDFTALVDTLKGVEDPDPAAGDYYEPGLDLLHALKEEKEDFGRAAPLVDASAELDEQIMGITDEAFHKAHTVLEAFSDGAPHGDGEPAPQLYMLMAYLGHISVANDIRRIRWLAAATDPAMGGEFY